MVDWVRPADALDQLGAGSGGCCRPRSSRWRRSPPYGTVADVLAAADRRVLDAVAARLALEGGELTATLPDGRVLRLGSIT